MHEMGQMPTVKSPGWLTRREVLDYYVEQTGRDVSNIHFYRVLTSFKLGVIFLQIYARFCRGTTADPATHEVVVAANFDGQDHTWTVPFPMSGEWVKFDPVARNPGSVSS